MLKLLPSFYNSPYANYNPTNLMNEEQRNFLEINTSVNKDLYASGINGFSSIKSLPMFNSPEDAKVINNGSAYLVLGPDNPYGPGTGKSKISNRADSIDGVVGRMSSNAEASKNPNIYVNNSFSQDAARIYIAEFTDLDQAAGLPQGDNPAFEDRSGFIGIADNVALKGRLGVKIVTSGNGEYNSRGGLISSGHGIELISRSSDADLQPLVKGDNLVKALESIYKRINELSDSIMDIAAQNAELNAALALHTHPLAIPAGIAGPSPSLAPTTIQGVVTNTTCGPINGLKIKVNTLLDEINYTYSLGSDYINSDLNRTN